MHTHAPHISVSQGKRAKLAKVIDRELATKFVFTDKRLCVS